MKLHNRIRRVRVEKGLSQAEVCKGIISASHYSNFENGRYQLGTDILTLLAERLSVPNSYFSNWNEDDQLVEELLSRYEKKVECENLEDLEQFYELQKEEFLYISSVRQEFIYHLIRFKHLFKSNRLEEAKELYARFVLNAKKLYMPLERDSSQKYYYISGLYYYTSGQWDECIQCFKKAMEVSEDCLLRAKILYNLSLAAYRLFDYENALLYAKEAKNIYLNLHDWEKTADCYNLVAVLFREKGSLAESEKYISKGLHIIGELDESKQTKLYHNLALVKLDQGDYQNALEWIEKSIHLKKELDTSDSLFISYRIRLAIFLNKKDILSLRKNLKLAKKHIKTAMDRAHYLFIEAQTFYLLEDYRHYETSIMKSIELFESVGNWKNLRTAAEHYANYLGVNRSYKKAYEYQTLCTIALNNYMQRRLT